MLLIIAFHLVLRNLTLQALQAILFQPAAAFESKGLWKNGLMETSDHAT
jgi:hypothetical protein